MPEHPSPPPEARPSIRPFDALVEGVARIAVLRANGLGGLMFALPALDALKRAYPRRKWRGPRWSCSAGKGAD